jgi:hypothetical protein
VRCLEATSRAALTGTGIGGSGLALSKGSNNVEDPMTVSAIRATARCLCVVSFGVFLGATETNAVAQQASPSIRQQARQRGGFERIVVSAYDPMQLSSLVARADLIVEASTAGGRSHLNTVETDIFTDYAFTVHTVISNNTRWANFPAGTAITVRRESGVVVVDGRTAVSHENGFAPFNANEHYILFLTAQPRDHAYSVFGGPQGAFSAGERITTLAVPLDEGAEPPHAMSRAAFLGEVRALLHFSEK